MDKQKIWILSGVVAGLAIATFFAIKKYRESYADNADDEDFNSLQSVPVEQPSRHITNVFAKAKHHQPM